MNWVKSNTIVENNHKYTKKENEKQRKTKVLYNMAILILLNDCETWTIQKQEWNKVEQPKWNAYLGDRRQKDGSYKKWLYTKDLLFSLTDKNKCVLRKALSTNG